MTDKAHTQDGVENPSLDAREGSPLEKVADAANPANTQRAGRDGKGRFLRGVSGNPRGKPKRSADVEEMFRGYTHAALLVILKTLRGPDKQLALQAARLILERGWGKITNVFTGPNGAPLVGASVTVNLGQPINDPNAAAAAYLRIIQGEPIDLNTVRFAAPERAARPALADRAVTDAEVLPAVTAAPEGSQAVPPSRDEAAS